MGGYKRLKDPIYGYIDIPEDYMINIIDTAEFQRLRRIIQTSYAPLYPSAVHNRFVHSMGVYYLGDIACKQLKKEISALKVIKEKELDLICDIFKLACLLHDVGHAPFSHTGEEFYKDDNNSCLELHKELEETVNDKTFSKDIPELTNAAAPHEIMSAIIGIRTYNSIFADSKQKDFFARCITGYKYSKNSELNDIKNCFIEMLNSKVIDVDRLDYLIRDAYITGFNTVDIDFERLLTSLTIVNDKGRYKLAYYKNAISVIENVVYAHDSERKWIQTHPVVLYEMYLLRGIISHINKEMSNDDEKLFSAKTLSQSGSMFVNSKMLLKDERISQENKNLKISLMGDDDIIFLMKNVYYNEHSNEFFERRLRRHPVWKSEAEYKTIILNLFGDGKVLDTFDKTMKDIIKYLEQNTDTRVIDNELISKLNDEIEKIEELSLDTETKRVQLQDKKNMLEIVKCLNDYAVEKNMKCDFVLLKASQFYSGFGKDDFSQINIVFDDGKNKRLTKVGEAVSSLKASEQKREDYFYLFYKRSDKEDENNVFIDKEEICRRMVKAMI